MGPQQKPFLHKIMALAYINLLIHTNILLLFNLILVTMKVDLNFFL